MKKILPFYENMMDMGGGGGLGSADIGSMRSFPIDTGAFKDFEGLNRKGGGREAPRLTLGGGSTI